MAMTVLHVAAAKPNPEAFLKVMSLPDAKALIDMVDEDGCTALHYAASEGRLEIVEALMRAGAATAPENSSGQTPLALAKEGAFDAVISLLENGLPPEPGAEGAEGGGEEEESYLGRGVLSGALFGCCSRRARVPCGRTGSPEVPLPTVAVPPARSLANYDNNDLRSQTVQF